MVDSRINRRSLIKVGGALAAGTLFTPALIRRAYAATTLNVAFTAGHEEAVKVAFFEPFTDATGIPIQFIVRRDNPAAEIRMQATSGTYQWDVSGALGPDTYYQVPDLCEPLDLTQPAVAPLPDYLKANGWIGYAIVAYTMAYQTEQYPGATLAWEDLLDTKTYPGMRALRKRVNENVELALRMSGVEPNDIYKVLATEEGWDRAFAKLDELRPVIDLWWESDAQTIPLLASGELSICPNYNITIDRAIAQGGKITKNWDRGFFNMNGFIIPKGAPNADLAKKFITFALDPARMAEYTQRMGFGPLVPGALDHMDPELAANCPTAPDHLAKIAPFNPKFWAENASQATERFNEWLLNG